MNTRLHIPNRDYFSGCRCPECTHIHTVRTKRSRLRSAQRARGAIFESDRVDARPAVLVLKAAQRRGMSASEITRVTKLDRSTIDRLLHSSRKKQNTCWRSTDIAIRTALADPENRAPVSRTHVSAKRSKQIIASLRAQGWSIAHLRDIIVNNSNHSPWAIHKLSRDSKEYVEKSTEDLVLWLANAIGDRIGPSSSTAKRAFNQGHFPNKHYDGVGDIIASSLSPEQRQQLRRVL